GSGQAPGNAWRRLLLLGARGRQYARAGAPRPSHSDPRLDHRRGGVLFVGPHKPYLAYVADVLPSLGEEGVQTCTLRDLVPQGATAAEETDPAVTRLKSSADLVRAIDTDRGDGAGRAGHPRRAPGRERAASIRSSGHRWYADQPATCGRSWTPGSRRTPTAPPASSAIPRSRPCPG